MSMTLMVREVNNASWIMRSDAVEHSFYADVFIDIWPVHPLPIPDKLKLGVASDNRQDHASATLRGA